MITANKKEKKKEEVHALKDSDKFKKCVCKILTKTPSCPPPKKPNNDNLNMDEFNKLHLSNDEHDSDASSCNEDDKWSSEILNVLVTLVSRESVKTPSKKSKVELNISINNMLLMESCKNLITMILERTLHLMPKCYKKLAITQWWWCWADGTFKWLNWNHGGNHWWQDP